MKFQGLEYKKIPITHYKRKFIATVNGGEKWRSKV